MTDKRLKELETMAEKKIFDMVDHPAHYTSNKYEAIDVIEDAISKLPPIEGFLTGQCLKYLLRWFFKNGVEDLKKTRWYLNRLIERLEKNAGV